MFKLALMSLCLVVRVNSECQNLENYPVFDHSRNLFICAHTYHDEGADVPIRGCNGDENVYGDGTNWTRDDGYGPAPVGSVVVMPGCTMTGSYVR